MSKTLKLQLTVGQYDQAERDEPGSRSNLRLQGDVFEARDQAEYDRLISIGAAVDPDKAKASEAEALRRRLAELEAELRATEAQLAATETVAQPLDPNDLKGAELDSALDARGLSTEGKVDEKRARLAASLSGTGNPAPVT